MAMYTKMTATGSSLITAPRTISKDLEAKIAVAIAGVIAKNDVSKLTTKLVRQAVEKEVHVSLTNHKEVLKRLMHQELRKIKVQRVAKRVAPEPWKMKQRRESMRKGMRYVYQWLQTPEAFDLYGLHAMQLLYDLQATETGDSSRLAVFYVRQLGALWLKQRRHLSWEANSQPTPAQVVEVLTAIFITERVGVCHNRRVELLQFFDRSPPVYSVLDYIGWNPLGDLTTLTSSSEGFQRMTHSLFLAYYAHCLNVSVGCTVFQAMQHLPAFYPYKGPNEISGTEYRQQLQMISTVVMVVTNFGQLKCEPELLPHEYFLLRHHLVHFVTRHDVAVVAEILKALRCFVGSDNLIPVRRGMAILMLTQMDTGCWKPAADATPASSYFTSMNAILALGERETYGYAPSIPDLSPLLEINLNSEVGCPKQEDIDAVTDKEVVKKEVKKEVSHDEPMPEAATSGSQSDSEKMIARMAEEEDLATQVKFLQSMLEDGGNVKTVPAALAKNVLKTLGDMKLNVEILKSTGIGRVINKLRKHSTEEVAQTAAQLVAKWKKDLL